jgi:hypothetical protein
MSRVSCCTIYPLSPISDFSVFFPDVPISFICSGSVCISQFLSKIFQPEFLVSSTNLLISPADVPLSPLGLSRRFFPCFLLISLYLPWISHPAFCCTYFSQTSLFSSPIFLYLSYFPVFLLDLPLSPRTSQYPSPITNLPVSSSYFMISLDLRLYLPWISHT